MSQIPLSRNVEWREENKNTTEFLSLSPFTILLLLFCFTNCVYYATVVMMILSGCNKNKLTDLSKPNAMSAQMFLYFQCDIRRGKKLQKKKIFSLFLYNKLLRFFSWMTYDDWVGVETEYEICRVNWDTFVKFLSLFKFFDWNSSKEGEE